MKRYNEALKLCEIQGGSAQAFNNLYIPKRNLRITKDRTIQYNLILGLGEDDAADIAKRIYKEGGEIAVALFDFQYSKFDVVKVIQSVKDVFPALICAVAMNEDEKGRLIRTAEIFTSPSEWVYFLGNYIPEQMEQLIAHLISSFVLHREKEIALAKNEATREGLRQILDASPELLKSQTEKQLSQFILKNLRMLTGATNTYLLILDQEKKTFRYAAGTGDFQNEEDFKRIEYEKKLSIWSTVLEDIKVTRFKDYVLVPLWVQAKPIGLLCLDRENILTRGTELLDVLAHHVAFAIENRRLQKEIEQKQAMEHELNLAARIQSSLLPKSFPQVPGIGIYGVTRSAKEIGGDYFDVISSENHLHFCIGDVSGKGVPAGLIMSELRSIVRSFAISYKSPKDILLHTAQLLLQDIGGSGKFVSMLLFQWDGQKLLYSSAGHEHILHYHVATGACEAIRSGGVVLGVDYRSFSRLTKEKELTWEPGDAILLFTDGATEAMNTEKKMFTLPALQKTVEKYYALPLQEMVSSVMRELLEFIGEAEQHDDITLLGIKYYGQKALDEDEDSPPENPSINNADGEADETKI